MKTRLFVLSVLMVSLALATGAPGALAREPGPAAGPALDPVTAAAQVAPPVAPAETRLAPETVLWDNGPLVTHPGDCSGQDASRLQ